MTLKPMQGGGRLKSTAAALTFVLALGAGTAFPEALAAAQGASGSGYEAAEAFGDHTALAVAPGLMLLARGAAAYAASDDPESLPWNARPEFLAILGIALAAFLLKDFIPFEPLQKLLAASEEGFMYLLGALSLGASLPSLAPLLAPLAQEAAGQAAALVFAPPAHAQAGEAAYALASGAWAAAAQAVAAVAGAAVFAVTWCVANVVNVLLLVSPAFAAPVLKGGRAAAAGALAALQAVHPLLGLAASLLVVLLCILVVRWSFRFTVWGTLFSFDLLTRRWRIPDPALAWEGAGLGAQAFAGHEAARLLGVPKRSLGTLRVRDGALRFAWRRFLFFAKEVQVPGPLMVFRRLAAPALGFRDPQGKVRVLFVFRLRHRGHEELLRRALGAWAVEDSAFSPVRAWAWLKGLFGSRGAQETAW
ncbi:MAG: hypothetical protein LBW85_09590 [Deltaproteobacteria bacterium]|jgi:hypothetical protein|nr:hypothetical protein [Deltaproteobacteria bacterium]